MQKFVANTNAALHTLFPAPTCGTYFTSWGENDTHTTSDPRNAYHDPDRDKKADAFFERLGALEKEGTATWHQDTKTNELVIKIADQDRLMALAEKMAKPFEGAQQALNNLSPFPNVQFRYDPQGLHQQFVALCPISACRGGPPDQIYKFLDTLESLEEVGALKYRRDDSHKNLILYDVDPEKIRMHLISPDAVAAQRIVRRALNVTYTP